MTSRARLLNDLFLERFSCRAFRPEPVPRATIENIVRIASRAPSWCNAQPWQIAITEPEETNRLRALLRTEAAQSSPSPDMPFPIGYTGVYRDRRRACGWQLYAAVGVEKGDRNASNVQMMRNFDLFDAPHCAILSSPIELGGYGALDCGGFVTAFTIAARAYDVDTVAQAAVASYAPLLHQHFAIDSDRMILCAISFGYADPDHPANKFRTERASLREIISWVA